MRRLKRFAARHDLNLMSRAQLDEKAKALGVTVSSRMKDDTVRRRIREAS